MRVRLIKKLAEMIDGVDLSANELGDMLDLDRSEARLLLAEGWAVSEPEAPTSEHRHQYMFADSQSTAQLDLAADRPRSLKLATRRLR
jgi:hypothetical protein